MSKEFIVAIELGSSKLTGIAGKKNLDGSITILAVVQEDSSSYIRRGVIYNMDKTMTALINVRKRLENLLQTHITQVYVGVGGQSIIGVKNVIVRDLAPDTQVSQEMIDELMDANRNMNYPDQEILNAITLEYKVDQQFQNDPVGIQCTHLEGNFLNILWRNSFYRNLNRCFAEANIPIAEMYLAPLALADNVLAEAERRAGCVLVDLGADTTTVSVYFRNVLRHLAVIPLGSACITRDIASLQMEDYDAERLKLEYGSAYTDNGDIDNSQQISIDGERAIDYRKFVEIVEARVEEIVANVWFQVPNEYAEKLLGGIILTGGGANMKNIEQAFRNHTRIEKIRISKTINKTLDSTHPEVTAHDCRLNTVLGLLAKGNMNCAGEPLKNDLFHSDGESVDALDALDMNKVNGQGIVQTEAEKHKAEEEEARKKAEVEAEHQRQEEAELERILQQKRENSTGRKLVRGFKNFLRSLVSDEE